MMKIAIPSNDEKTIFPRTGRARGYMVYHIENKNVKRKYYRALPVHLRHRDDEDEDHEHSHKELVEFLKDCDIVLVKGIGKFLKQDFAYAGLNYKLVKEEKLNDIVQSFL